MMYKINEIINKIIYGDNLEEMKKIPDESVDLIYLDPPFFSGRDYEIIFGDEDKFPGFSDIWKGEDGKEVRVGDIENYKKFMRERLVEIRRILKSTGTIFLHCDKHAAHHLRLMLDDVFINKTSDGKKGKFLNEIIWCYYGGGQPKDRFPQKHDNIYWYAKDKNWVFNDDSIRVPYDSKYKGTSFVAKGSRAPGKSYKPNILGKIPEDWWIISRAYGKERLGYPTQKPEKLLERIILAASSERDIVFDPFCGCGTTIAVAKRLKRKFIGIDWSKIGCKLVADRIGQKVGDIINVIDFTSMDGFTWQKMACYLMGAKSNPKERADGGIDGWFPDKTGIGVRKGKADNKFMKEFAQSIKLNENIRNDIGLVVADRFSKTAEEVVAKLETQENVVIIMMTNKEVLNDDFERLRVSGIGHEYDILQEKYEWKLPKRNTYVYKMKEKKRKTNPLI